MRESRRRDPYALLIEFIREGERLPWHVWFRVGALWAWARLRHLTRPEPWPARRRWWFVEVGADPAALTPAPCPR